HKNKTDELLDEKAATTDLSNYMTLGTSQTINANKTFNNSCRFVSSIDGMSTVTESSFIKQGTDDTVDFLRAGGTKPIAELGGSVYDSNYVKKTGQITQSITGKLIRTDSSESFNNLENMQYPTKYEIDVAFIKNTGKNLQIVHGVLQKGEDEVSLSEDEDDYLTRAAVNNSFVSRSDNQTMYGTKTFNSNVNATGFVKTGKDDTSVLLAGDGDQLLSSFGGVQVEDITDLIINLHSNITFNYLKLARIGNFYTLMMEIQPITQISTTTSTTICSIGSYSTCLSPPTPPSTTYSISLATKRKTLICVHSFRDIQIITNSTEAWDINDDVGLQFSWMV
ncbi:MAG: hypothetical protein EZS28_042712, partial [Streblomastix strix]